MQNPKRAISLGASALIVIALIIVVAFGVYLNATFNTASTTSSSISLCQGLPCSTAASLNTTSSTTHSGTTETMVSNYTETSSAVVKSSETPSCVPTSGYISTTTITEQSTTTTEQVGYEGTPCNFGDNSFEPPSAILIPANTLVWTNFRLNVTSSDIVGASITLFPFPESVGANIIVAIYLNGGLVANSTTPLPDQEIITQTPLIPPSDSSYNSIFALTGVTPTVGMGTQTGSAVSLNGATIGIAMISDKPLWLAGWTQQDMAKGTGPQFGQSIGQLKGTYEGPDSELSQLPNSLPQPTTTLTFELQFTGDYFP